MSLRASLSEGGVSRKADGGSLPLGEGGEAETLFRLDGWGTTHTKARRFYHMAFLFLFNLRAIRFSSQIVN